MQPSQAFSSTSTLPSQDELQPSKEVIDLADDVDNDSGPPTKKIKPEVTEEGTAKRFERISKKVVTDTNAVLELSYFEGRVDKSHVQVSTGPSGCLKVSVMCLLCRKEVSLSSTPYSTEIGNFKRHFMNVHVEATSESEGKRKIKDRSQGLVTNYFKSVGTNGQQVVPEPESDTDHADGTKNQSK